jgi:putative membrane-bound dehydrogenase-like protein
MFRTLAALFLALTSMPLALAQSSADEGIRPVGADGQPLNLDFETGTLKDWTAEGAAFAGQPIKGDTVHPRRADMKSEHQGQFWIGTYERQGDRPQGTLTSVPFKVTHPWATFLVGGGSHATTCVEIVRRDNNEVIARTAGTDEENLRRVAVDLRAHLGQQIYLRLVDRHSGGWGHINFDDFRFHAAKPSVSARRGPQPPSPPDVYKFSGLTPEKAAAAMTVPEGFRVKLFAGEPDVHQPIAFCLDDRGRLWVAEAYSYPVRRPDKEARDRILIFEDADGDGHFDKQTVFMEGLNLVSGLEIGFGGVWIGAAPYLMFVPMKDDKPAGPPQILLDGWAYQDTHETLNSFIWGPDGWLYGCHGVFTHSRVGKPGTPDAQRVPINAGIWRYHPTKHIFEVFAHGTSNPWGLDFDDWGQAFCEACVIPHAFHVIQGARYQRQAGSHFNPYTYADIQTIADHRHYVGANPHGGNNRSDSAGGGHAHCGTMIYLGGAWPAEYRNQWFMGNIHGRRLNMDRLQRKGSGYVASHGPDFLLANDEWARFINMRYGPDGNVYLIDWYDKQACHHKDINIWDRTNGRIYKIEYRGTKPVKVDLQQCTDEELVKYQLHENDWYVRHARRILQERYAPGSTHRRTGDAIALLGDAINHPDAKCRLRAAWALHAVGVSGVCVGDKDPRVQAWFAQLMLENRKIPDDNTRNLLVRFANDDFSPIIRLFVASGLQRLPLVERWKILESLLSHGEDAKDHNLPLVYWYAAEPLAAEDPGRALDLAARSKVPMLEFMARRVGAIGTPEAIALLVERLKQSDNGAAHIALLTGLQEGLKGRRRFDMPAAWPDVFAKLRDSKNAEIHNRAVALAVIFGDTQALTLLRAVLAKPQADMQTRRSALEALRDARDKELAPVLHQVLAEPALRGAALRALAAYDDPNTPAIILKVYSSLSLEEKRDALNTLAARAGYAKALLAAVASKEILSTQVPAEIVRQLRNLKDAEIDKRLSDIWGTVREARADRIKLINQYRKQLAALEPRDPALGRAIFAKTCAQCHTLFGIGGTVGPELTGSNRANLDYLLENILDPSAVIPKDYAVTRLELKDGRVLTGIVKAETPRALTVVTANETLTVPADEIDARKPTDSSMMPDDLLKPLSAVEVRSLVAYLQSPVQAPLLATPENAKDFFNGKDLTGWDGDPKLWKVENGEIVGKSPGMKKNQFLRSQMAAGDFRLTLKVKLTPNKENSGVQFRSQALPDGEMKGYQADIGAGWWGKLYEESGRGLVWNKEAKINVDDWNEYIIEATGSRIRTFLNGQPCVDLDDPRGDRRGIFALQLHAGGPMEVRFKDLRLEVKP